jgi:DNA repair protein RecN (Recombination protein N)
VVVIDHLHIDFQKGFSVLTGETGAGKSILLDSLGLVLGNRAQPKLIREGAQEASVTIVYDPIPKEVGKIFSERDINFEAPLIIRRTLTREGKSRNFLNDQPVSMGLLSQISPHMIEIHGQFDHLLDSKKHLGALDHYANISVQGLKKAYQSWQEAERDLQKAQDSRANRIQRLEELGFLISEIERLSPKEDEEKSLLVLKGTQKYADHIQKISQIVESFSEDPLNIEAQILNLQRLVLKNEIKAFSFLEKQIEALLISLNDIQEEAQKISLTVGRSSLSLDQIEERLYNLNQVARRHQADPNNLGFVLQNLRKEKDDLLRGDASLDVLQAESIKQKDAYKKKASELYLLRMKAGKDLGGEIKIILKDLKLPHALLDVSFQELSVSQWSDRGMHRVEFYISTNPGISPGPLSKVASGGELSRVMLALKSILKEKRNIPTIIFDEVDTGLGGAVASAMGEQLSRLSSKSQVLAITHSPQLASHSDHHLFVEKVVSEEKTTTFIRPLDEKNRLEELSRMLSGKEITNQARAVAKELLKDKVSI